MVAKINPRFIFKAFQVQCHTTTAPHKIHFTVFHVIINRNFCKNIRIYKNVENNQFVLHSLLHFRTEASRFCVYTREFKHHRFDESERTEIKTKNLYSVDIDDQKSVRKIKF